MKIDKKASAAVVPPLWALCNGGHDNREHVLTGLPLQTFLKALGTFKFDQTFPDMQEAAYHWYGRSPAPADGINCERSKSLTHVAQAGRPI